MPLFVCAKCKCVENTALGLWWCRNIMQDKFCWTEDTLKFKGQGLCSLCAPTRYDDGTLTGYGVWHGRFKREHFLLVDYKDQLLQLPQRT